MLRPAEPADPYLVMAGKEVYRQAIPRMAASSKAVLERAGWTPADVDRFVGHQANVRILDAVARRLGIPEDRCVVNIDRVGNTAAASIPLALADAAADGTLQPGHRVLLTAFGGGLTWGSAVLTWPTLEMA
jgi:3-oxoacyl-[acyl-carrier-protein] synthase-3